MFTAIAALIALAGLIWLGRLAYIIGSWVWRIWFSGNPWGR